MLNKTVKIIKDIKSLKIQGATNVAINALEALFYEYITNSDKINIENTYYALIETRPTEPMLRNTLKYFLINSKKTNPYDVKKEILNYIDSAKNKIKFYGSQIIKNNKTYFTHCHSGTVTSILINARKNKLFRVINTETRPLYQGRITAKELSQNNIPVMHFVDSGGKIGIKNSDAVLLGADAITNKGDVYNKIGSEMFAIIAKHYKKKVFIATLSWKLDPLTFFGFDEKIEIRNKKEVWKNPPKNVIINNYAFEKINHNFIDKIITEYGILSPKEFIRTMKKHNKWMFKLI